MQIELHFHCRRLTADQADQFCLLKIVFLQIFLKRIQ